MKRGEVWTISGGSGYAGKPRPAVIVQSDEFSSSKSVTICAFTSNPLDAEVFRPVVEPSAGNGLRQQSRLMADKIMTVPRSRLGARIGAISSRDIENLSRAITVFLGLVR